VSGNLGLPDQASDFSGWYNELVVRADLADHSPVRGCMIIKPHGYALWELMQAALDGMFKATGHVNAYFPLLIPKSFLAREAAHVEGFAKECAVVTHYRLKNDPDGTGIIVDPEAKLEEELIIRPTSETIIWNTYSKWIQSYRDLPLLINQWANVMRWEMRTRLFLRTSEFLWQEGHTAHATYEEAEEESLTILNECYTKFCEDYMAVPVIKGVKSDGEKFAGADHTYTIEALTQDLRAIQAGTSHHLGQNFAKAFDCKFLDTDNTQKYVYSTSWGVSTRLIGTLIMVHSDARGLVLPPKLAPVQIVLIPMGRDAETRSRTVGAAEAIENELRAKGVRVKIDKREKESPGFKYNYWELRGACARVEIGPRDLDAGRCVVARRDTGEKTTVQLGDTVEFCSKLLDDTHSALYEKALAFREQNTHRVDDWQTFQAAFEGDGGGGFVLAHWDGTAETEAAIAAATKATIRCIPLEPLAPEDALPGKCVYSGDPSKQRVVFAKAY
jgi:prolyl-tRNA synthetase